MGILLLLLLALAGPALLFGLALSGRRLRKEAAAAPKAPGSWPSVGVVVPCAGTHPDMEAALRSLVGQNYEGRKEFVLVTATADEPAARLADRLAAEFGEVRHAVAGPADGCGQKNRNSLAGVAALGDSVDVYAFCDSTHLASPDFLCRLVLPLAAGEASFATGYHEVVPRDDEPVTLAYAFCVLAMRIMQGLPGCTQPWGGAMAIRRSLFRERDVAGFWATNVVDDCSLVLWLKERGVEVRLCPGALLRTRAERHSRAVWLAWLDRQILFLKFCVPFQWAQLGLLLLFMAAVPAAALCAAFGSPALGLPALLLAGAHLLATAFAVSALRPLLPRHVPLLRWLGAYWLVCLGACLTFLKTVPASGILWHGIWYDVGKGGRVLKTSRNRSSG